jgi:hypothetical protein
METQLTKEQRHEIYKLALARAKENEKRRCSFFLCEGLSLGYSKIFGDTVLYCDVLEMFPECLSQKPPITRTFTCWFDWNEYKPRIKILKKCIEETKP